MYAADVILFYERVIFILIIHKRREVNGLGLAGCEAEERGGSVGKLLHSTLCGYCTQHVEESTVGKWATSYSAVYIPTRLHTFMKSHGRLSCFSFSSPQQSLQC